MSLLTASTPTSWPCLSSLRWFPFLLVCLIPQIYWRLDPGERARHHGYSQPEQQTHLRLYLFLGVPSSRRSNLAIKAGTRLSFVQSLHVFTSSCLHPRLHVFVSPSMCSCFLLFAPPVDLELKNPQQFCHKKTFDSLFTAKCRKQLETSLWNALKAIWIVDRFYYLMSGSFY